MRKIVRIYVDHTDRVIDISIGRIVRTGAYHFYHYENISDASQQRILKLIHGGMEHKFFGFRLRDADILGGGLLFIPREKRIPTRQKQLTLGI